MNYFLKDEMKIIDFMLNIIRIDITLIMILKISELLQRMM